ncbi:MAG: hypothetical protein WCE54_15265 [Ignavibacteriaceae bacterium]
MDELEGLIEPNRYLILSKLILFNKTYAEYLLNFEEIKNKIDYSENHLFWSNKNELLETRHIGIYGFNKDESRDSILEDNQLKPLLISYLSIKSIMQNDKKIFNKWQLSFNNLAEELNNSINEADNIPEDKLEIFQKLIKEIKKNR